jgi:hypothetical protein
MMGLRDIMFIICLVVLVAPVIILGGLCLYQIIKAAVETGNPLAICIGVWVLAASYFIYYLRTEKVD